MKKKFFRFLKKYGLGLIIAYFIILNLFTIDWMLPNVHDPGEDSHILTCLDEVKNSKFTQYSPAFCNFIFVSQIPIYPLSFFSYAIKDNLVFTVTSIILYHRILLILLGIGGISLIYKLTIEITNKRSAGLLSAFILACNPLYIKYTNLPGKPDFYLWILIVLFFYFYFAKIYKQKLNLNKTLILSSITAGIVSLKYNSIFLFIPISVIFLKEGIKILYSKKVKPTKNYYLIFFIFVFLFGIMINVNGINSDTFSSQGDNYFVTFGHEYNLLFTNYLKLNTYEGILEGLNFIYPISILIIFALFLVFSFFHSKKSRFLFYSSLSYMLWFSFFLRFYPRHLFIPFLILIPCFCYGIYSLKKYKFGRKIFSLLIIFLIIFNIAYSLNYIGNFTNDPRLMAKTWISENLEKGEITIFANKIYFPYVPGFFYSRKSLEKLNFESVVRFMKTENPRAILIFDNHPVRLNILHIRTKILDETNYSIRCFEGNQNLNNQWNHFNNPPSSGCILFLNESLIR